MNVRFATPKDKKEVLTLYDEFSLFLKAHDIPSEVGGAMFDEVIRRDDTMIFIAEENGKIIGLVTFFLLPNIRHGFKRGHIEDFFVTESKRNSGVGTLLLDAVKDYCRKNSIKVVKLDSGNELVSAHMFYSKKGGKTTEKFFRFDID